MFTAVSTSGGMLHCVSLEIVTDVSEEYSADCLTRREMFTVRYGITSQMTLGHRYFHKYYVPTSFYEPLESSVNSHSVPLSSILILPFPLLLNHLFVLFSSMCRTNIMYVFHYGPTCACYMSWPFRPYWFDHHHHISWWLQATHTSVSFSQRHNFCFASINPLSWFAAAKDGVKIAGKPS
jgi:hypothetical protein